MEHLSLLFNNLVELSAEASPWLLLGLVIAGLMKAWVPTKVLSKHLGHGKKAIVKAALIGAPLPLCSCGVIPVATELKRSGASNPATSAFLVATPETGVDSVSVSYAMLGPIFAIYRPITAILSAIFTGLLVTSAAESPSLDKSKSSSSTCCSKKAEQEKEKASCCSSNSSAPTKKENALSKTLTGLHYAATKLVDDLAIWLLIGLVFATIVRSYVPESFLLQYGSGLPAMLLMIAISIPMYICATASTPIAAGFIMAGLSPGTALVFMMAGPATNISTLGVIKNEMGSSVLGRYLLGISISAISFGILLDYLIQLWQVDISKQMQHSHELLPSWVGISATILIVLLAIKPLRCLVLNK